tara:strand:- start:52 stop:210 length:159 start_codon:yes stop_codon:yes gene_type:complete
MLLGLEIGGQQIAVLSETFHQLPKEFVVQGAIVANLSSDDYRHQEGMVLQQM